MAYCLGLLYKVASLKVIRGMFEKYFIMDDGMKMVIAWFQLFRFLNNKMGGVSLVLILLDSLFRRLLLPLALLSGESLYFS